MSYQFHFYPTLLNAFQNYKNQREPKHLQKLIDRINRVPERDPKVLKRFKRGNSFENAVLKNADSDFDPSLIEKTQKLLPKDHKTQQFVECYFDNVRFYGYADVVGEERVIDLKSTALHRHGRHALNSQNLYLYALRDYGFRQIEYIICDGKEIFIERYKLATYDFNPLLELIHDFKDFLLDHKTLIVDRKIMKEVPPGLFD